MLTRKTDKTCFGLAAGTCLLLGACASRAYEPAVPVIRTTTTVPAASGDTADTPSSSAYDYRSTTRAMDRDDPPGYDRYGALPRTARAAPAAPTPVRAGGIDASRRAHRSSHANYAEQIDGGCEPSVYVEIGETLSDIAEYCDTTVTALMRTNGIRYPEALQAGQLLAIPAERGNVYDGYIDRTRPRYADYRTRELPPERDRDVYIVRRGDTMSAIARRSGTSLARLERLNPHIDPWNIDVGERVVLPTQTIARAERYDPLPARGEPRLERSGGQSPVVVYIGDNGEKAERYAQSGKAVIIVDDDEEGRSGAWDSPAYFDKRRGVVTKDAPFGEARASQRTVIEGPALPRAPSYQLRTSLPDSRASSYDDLGTACLSDGGGQARIYEASTGAAGPSCPGGRPVRLYRSGDAPR